MASTPAFRGGQVDARFGAALDDAHGFQDRKRLADLPAADAEMFGELALGWRAAAHARIREQIGCQIGAGACFLSLSPVFAHVPLRANARSAW
jgi:hypothetical protein